jgi:hypothetical protein
LRELDLPGNRAETFSIKGHIHLRYEGLDISLGRVKSTGEVMGMNVVLALPTQNRRWPPPPLPKTGKVFVSVKTPTRKQSSVAREFVKLGFEIISTKEPRKR